MDSTGPTTSAATTRKMADTSFETEEGTKIQKVDVEMPAWAAVLVRKIDDLSSNISNIEAEVRNTNTKFDNVTKRMEDLELKVEETDERVVSVEEEVVLLRQENTELRGMFAEMRKDLDDQIDRGLRDHLVFYGVKGTDRTWAQTEGVLVDLIHKTLDGDRSKESYADAITRAHRGPFIPGKSGPRPIFVQMDFKLAEKVRSKEKFGGGFGAGVNVKDQYSKNTQKRVNEALVFRKSWKADHPNEKAFISFPATLKVWDNAVNKYKIEEVF